MATVSDVQASALPLEILDRAIESATNDEMLELCYRVLENLGDRAEAAADFAIDSDERDVENEAMVFIAEVEKIPQLLTTSQRVEDVWHRAYDAKKDLGKAIRNRRARLDGRLTALEQYSHRRRNRASSHRAEEILLGWARAEKNLKLARITEERVVEALATASAKGEVRVIEVVVALDGRFADTSRDGRQDAVAQVGKILRRLASEGRVTQIRPENYDHGRRHPHRYAMPEVDAA